MVGGTARSRFGASNPGRSEIAPLSTVGFRSFTERSCGIIPVRRVLRYAGLSGASVSLSELLPLARPRDFAIKAAVPMETSAIDSALDRIEFDANGLAPAIVQDAESKQVLMLGFMTRQMLAKTLESGQVWFWSRSRQEPWLKGATSGNYLNVVQVYRNCEENSLLILARPDGPTCHTGAVSCYYRTLDEE